MSGDEGLTAHKTPVSVPKAAFKTAMSLFLCFCICKHAEVWARQFVLIKHATTNCCCLTLDGCNDLIIWGCHVGLRSIIAVQKQELYLATDPKTTEKSTIYHRILHHKQALASKCYTSAFACHPLQEDLMSETQLSFCLLVVLAHKASVVQPRHKPPSIHPLSFPLFLAEVV